MHVYYILMVLEGPLAFNGICYNNNNNSAIQMAPLRHSMTKLIDLLPYGKVGERQPLGFQSIQQDAELIRIIK